MKKILSIALTSIIGLSLIMPFGNENIVYAEENTGTELEVEFVDSLDEIKQGASQEISIGDLSQGYCEMEREDFSGIGITDADLLGEFQADGISAYASSSSITQTFTGTLEQEGGLTYLPVTLAPGEILQATLAGPNRADINYDLILYTYDNGNLGSYVTESSLTTYINSGINKSVEDAIAYINTGSITQTYVVVVYATRGCSSTDTFKLTVSLDAYENYDAGEPNDNPLSAIEVSAGVTISNCNLNVSNDQDWYVCQIPTSLPKVELKLSNSVYSVEVYHASGKSMILDRPDDAGFYNLNPGYYYFRVYYKGSNFVSSVYSLEIKMHGTTPAKMVVVFNGDMGTTIPSYPEGQYYRFEATMRPMVLITDAAGFPVEGQEVLLLWRSKVRPESSGLKEAWQTQYTDSEGVATFDLTPPQSTGSWSCIVAGSFRHYYDVDSIGFTCGNLQSVQDVYHFSHSVLIGL